MTKYTDESQQAAYITGRKEVYKELYKLEYKFRELEEKNHELQMLLDGYEKCESCDGDGCHSNGCHGNDPAYEESGCGECNGEGWVEAE